jgi:hypothetical protein
LILKIHLEIEINNHDVSKKAEMAWVQIRSLISRRQSDGNEKTQGLSRSSKVTVESFSRVEKDWNERRNSKVSSATVWLYCYLYNTPFQKARHFGRRALISYM